MTSILIDTNVLIYAIDRDSKYHMWASRFFTDSSYTCLTTSKNISEFLCVLTRGEAPIMSTEEALSATKVFLTHLKVLYPDRSSLSLLFDLIREHKVSGLQVHDFGIASIALSNGFSRLATVNKVDFSKIEGLEVISPG